jgi:AraC family transcriptional regulator
MPVRKEIENTTGAALYSLQVYPPSYFLSFNPATVFEKWAAAEVSGFEKVPTGMECFELPGGLYAVFLHKGSSTDTSTFQYIFSQWLPNADHVLDNRPHFELLGEKYKNGDPASEEEIWIPVKAKKDPAEQ